MRILPVMSSCTWDSSCAQAQQGTRRTQLRLRAETRRQASLCTSSPHVTATCLPGCSCVQAKLQPLAMPIPPHRCPARTSACAKPSPNLRGASRRSRPSGVAVSTSGLPSPFRSVCRAMNHGVKFLKGFIQLARDRGSGAANMLQSATEVATPLNTAARCTAAAKGGRPATQHRSMWQQAATPVRVAVAHCARAEAQAQASAGNQQPRTTSGGGTACGCSCSSCSPWGAWSNSWYLQKRAALLSTRVQQHTMAPQGSHTAARSQRSSTAPNPGRPALTRPS